MSDLLGDLTDYQAKDPEQALDDAVAAVRSHCGWDITPEVTEAVDVWSTDGRMVFIDTLALTAVSSLVQDGVTLSASTYTFEPYGVIRRTPDAACFSKLTKVTATVTHGLADWPTEVKSVILSLAQRAIADTRGMVPRLGGAGASSVIMENYGAQLGEGDKAKLAAYTLAPGSA